MLYVFKLLNLSVIQFAFIFDLKCTLPPRVYICFHIFSLSTHEVLIFTCKFLNHLEFILVNEMSQESDSPIEIRFLPKKASRSSRKEVRHSQTVFLRGSQKEKKKTSDGKPAYSIVITPCIENKPSTEEISLLGYPMSPTFSDCWVININLSHPAIQLWVSGKDPNIIQENIGRTQKMNPCYLLANTLSG